MATQEKNVNGIDVNAFNETCNAIKQDPSIANAQFWIHNEWDEGGHNAVTIQNYFAANEECTRSNPYHFDADEPPQLLGKDRGANPVEYLLSALSSCMTTSIIYHAAARGINIESLSSEFKGDIDLQGFLGLDESVPKGYKQIEVTFKVECDAPLEELEGLYAFSPVYAMVSKAVPINVTFKKVES